MSYNMGSVTQLAYNNLQDEQQLMEQFLTAEDALDYLQNEDNFKNLSTILKETMVKAGVCNETDPQSRFAKELHKRLVAQDVTCGKGNERSEAAVKRWISSYTKRIDYRNTAIEICFALELDKDLSRDFLFKCGFHSFNVRDAEDAIYLYCMLKHRPLSDAKTIYAKYLASDTPDDNTEQSQCETAHSGHTTMLLRNQVLGSWEDDDAFLNTFLIPNKSKFLGYSFTATKTYYILKNILFITVLTDLISEEEHLEAERYRFNKRVEDTNVNPGISGDMIPYSLALRSALEKYNNSESVLYTLNQKLRKKTATPKEILIELRKMITCKTDDINTDINIQKEVALFLNDIIKNEELLKRVLQSLINKTTGRLRKKTQSELKDTVMKNFPYANTFTNIENEPSAMYDKERHGETVATRKALVLMYYIIYSYELPLYLNDLKYVFNTFCDVATAINIPDQENTFEEYKQMGFLEFFESLNIILDYCQVSKLYPLNQYDWLVLRSIREIEVNTDDEDETYNPIAFFNNVLAYSYGLKKYNEGINYEYISETRVGIYFDPDLYEVTEDDLKDLSIEMQESSTESIMININQGKLIDYGIVIEVHPNIAFDSDLLNKVVMTVCKFIESKKNHSSNENVT